MVLRVVRALGLAFAMAVLLAIIGSIIAPLGRENLFSTLFFLIGFVVCFILMLKADRAGFWFCLSFAIEWALLPVAAAINLTQTQTTEQSGCALLAGAVLATVFLYVTIPVGAAGFILFFLLAMLVFRKKKPRAAEVTADQASQP